MALEVLEQLDPNYTGVLIFLHGKTRDGTWQKQFFLDLLKDKAHFKHVKVIFPSSPELYCEHSSKVVKAWFSVSKELEINQQHVDEAVDFLDTIIRVENENGIPLNRMIIGGISQGGMLAIDAVYRSYPDVAGCITVSSLIQNNKIFELIVMLTSYEQRNVEELLQLVPLVDLLSVAAVVTNKAFNFQNSTEAVKAILLHESSYLTLLNRRKITRNVLLSYLHSKEISCEGTSDKGSLIDKVIKFWNSKAVNQGEQSNGKIHSSINHNEKEEADISAGKSESASVETELAKQFTSWFYSKLNEDFLKKGGPIIGVEDFWPDCHTVISLPGMSELDFQDYTASNAEETVNMLRGLRTQYDLFFSPNVNFDGVRAKSDPHGLILVAACGTLHSRAGECVGVFEQTFGLIADPMSDNNFKIKRTMLCLKKGTQNQPRAILSS